MSNQTIVLLAGRGVSTNILYRALQKDFTITAIILEEPVSKISFLKKRIKKLGFGKVTGQILFQLIIVNFLNLVSGGRKKQIQKQFDLNDEALPFEKIIPVVSVNDNSCIQILQRLDPQLVIVNGTRIIKEDILQSIPAKFINLHAGITPMYRGVHGAYWALVNNDAENCGVTVHLVDKGIDTGAIISQKTISVTSGDNFATYPLLQLAEGIPLMKMAIEDVLNDRLTLKPITGESRLWYHPTIWQYINYKQVK